MKRLYFFRSTLHRFSRSYFSSEIRIQMNETKDFFPIRGVPEFTNGKFTVFEYQQEPVKVDEQGEYQRLPQVPYEIKENALKGFVYTFFLTILGRLASNWSLKFMTTGTTFFPIIPAGVFTYFYGRSLWYMYNSVTAVHLKEDGKTIVLTFKNNLQSPIEVEISRITKKKEENFLMECYTEPFLFPIQVDYTDKYGPYSLRNKRTFYLYGDSHSCIKHGEILRAVLNSQNIKTK
jgi:hypothetical protein